MPVVVTASVVGVLIAALAVTTSLYIRVQRAQARVARLESQMEVDRKLSTAQRLYAEGQYQAALSEVEAHLLKDGSDVKMRLLHAQLLFDLGRPMRMPCGR